MKRIKFVFLGLCLIAGGCATTGMNPDAVVLRAKDRVAPALVHIRPVKEVFTEGKREEVLVLGSGFIISPEGYIVTNEHVAGSSSVVNCVLYTKEELEADVVGVDRATDVAVLKLKSERTNFPFVRLGSSANLKAGQTVLALGSPHGLARSVSKGIVSVPDRYIGSPEPTDINYNNWIQTDAAINPGNSGGPLVNLRGEVIGINARRLSGAENVGFAIPIDVAKQVIDSIIKQGRVVRAWIGVTFQEMSSKTNDPEQRGVVIADVEPLSPAAEAGLRPGDILVALNGTAVDCRFAEDLPKVNKMVADLPVGQDATLVIVRGGESLEITVKTEERSDAIGKEIEFPEWGFTATELTPELVRRAQLGSRMGVLVSGIQVGGIAAAAELSRGDIILKVDDADVPDLEAFRKLYKERVETKKRLVLLDVRRGALMRYVLIKQEPQSTGGE